ncbi:MAG: PQQ-binding-like beta-propeller repeat protein [Anaerolineae bacterium]|nr:PQQ-binding-like beta-propeller repeat protein [Anaerolineae bacterium]
MIWRRLIVIAAVGSGVLFSALLPHPTSAQLDAAPCGYIEGFDLPFPGIDITRTDFAIYRARFGGLHVGMDVAFEQLGEPVFAAARGRVTYSDPAGWDTEKGVVVIQHTLPDDSLINTVYGHMEELNGYIFPAMDQCVERGDIIGAIGFPSLGRPHLHYEIRTGYRHEGGPGYTETNPLELGWLHPVDFTYLARILVHPAYRSHFLLTESPTLPPLLLPDGSYVVAHSGHLLGLAPGGAAVWRFDTLGSVIGMLALPDDRVLVATSTEQVLVLDHGSYSALWTVPETFSMPPVLVGDTVVFATDDHTLMAFTPDGALVWETPPLSARIERWAVNGDRVAAATQDHRLYVVDASGQILHDSAHPDLPIPFAAEPGEFWLMVGSTVLYLDQTLSTAFLFDTERQFSPAAGLLPGASGMLYLYTGEGRSLYAYDTGGTLHWIAYMPGSHQRTPLLDIGNGELVYALTTDGQLLAYDHQDGRLAAQLALYDGGIEGSALARWLAVNTSDSGDIVRFGSGYLSAVTLNGPNLR